MPEIVTERGLVHGRGISVSVVRVRNATIVLCYEGEEPRLGTLALALPFGEGGRPLSAILLGERHTVLCRTLAEHVASSTEKISLVSVYVREIPAIDAGREALRLLAEIL